MVAALEIKAGIETVEINKGFTQIKDGLKDVSTSITASQNNLKNFENALKKATNPKEVEYLQRSISTLKGQLEVLNSTQNNLLGTQSRFVAGSNQASQALINLGRVAQDAPFGFIGIANNLNPLLESFQRLKVETGSTKGALQALGGSLMGAGGLGLALSVVTAAVSFASMGFQMWGVKNEEAKKKVDEHKKAIDSIYSSVAGEAAQVQSLIAVLQSETATRQRKNNALAELKKMQPEIFNGLKMEGDAVIGLDAAYKNYIANLQTVIAVKIKQQQLEKVTEQLLKNQGVTLSKNEKDIVNSFKIIGDGIKSQLQSQGRINELNKIDSKENETKAKQAKEYNALIAEQKMLFNDLKSLQEGVKVAEQKTNTERLKNGKTYLDVIKELRSEQLKLQTQFKFEQIDLTELTKGIQDAYKKAIGELGKMNAPTKVITTIAEELNIKFDRLKIADDAPIVAPVELNVTPKLDVAAIQKDADSWFKMIRDKYQTEIGQFQAITQLAVTNAFTSFGEGIASMVQGGNVLDALFGNLFRTFGDAFVQFGKQIVIQSALMQKIRLMLGAGKFSNSLALGLGMIAAGTLMKGIRIGSNAQGTDYWRGGLTMVGERGPELVSLPRGSRVTPNHEMGAIGGGMDLNIQPVTIFRGTELLVYFNRVTQLNNRVG